MSGCRFGVQNLFTEQVPHVLYVHFYTHRLNLVIVECFNSVTRTASSSSSKTFTFISSSVVHANSW